MYEAPGYLSPTEANTYIFDEITFKCNASSVVEWIYPASEPISELFTQGNYLTIYSALLIHAGDYKCIGKNEYGYNFVSVAKLNVMCKYSTLIIE